MKIKSCIALIIIITLQLKLLSIEYNKITIGNSVKNNKIDIYKFGKGNEIIVIIAGIHGNEPNTSKTSMILVDLLINDKIKIPENKAIWIIPLVNPDGILIDSRLNDNKVDLNRNFDTDNWQSNFYFYDVLLSAGTNPFSEPETQAIRNLFNSSLGNNKFIVLSLHSRGNMVIPANDSKGNYKLASKIAENSTYNIDSIEYKTSGDLTEWLSEKLEIASATIEFKSKNELEDENLKNIIETLLKCDFNSDIYKYGIRNNSDSQLNLESFLKGLPSDTYNKITGNEDNKSELLKLFKGIQSDEELLLLVNKSHHLSKDYKPNDLMEIAKIFECDKQSALIRKIILPDLTEMINDAKKDGIILKIVSSYRSFETQKNTYNYWVKTLGEEEAQRVSALPGASQHQLGTTIDFNSLEMNFAETKDGQWLLKNSYKYGFIMSYPKGKEELTGYKYEPWHYRYIGKEAAYMVYKYFNNLLEIFLSWYWDKKIDK